MLGRIIVVPHSRHIHHGVSASQTAALKKRLRELRWQPEAIMREVVLIQHLRELAMLEPKEPPALVTH